MGIVVHGIVLAWGILCVIFVIGIGFRTGIGVLMGIVYIYLGRLFLLTSYLEEKKKI